MSDKHNNRVLALVLGIVICLNVCIFNVKRTEAVVDAVTGYALAQALESLMLGKAVEAGQSGAALDATAEIVDAFIDHFSNTYPVEFSDWTAADNAVKAVTDPVGYIAIKSDAVNFAFDKFFDFVVDNYLDEDALVVPSSSGAYAAVNSLDNYWSYVDPIFMGVFNTDNVTWGFNRFRNTCQADRRYISIYRAVHNVSGEIFFAVLKSNSGYGVEGFVGSDCYGVYINSSNALAGFIDSNFFANYSMSLLGTCLYDTSLESSDFESATTAIQLRDEFLNDRVNILRDYVADNSATVVSHASDGSETAEKKTTISVMLREELDENGDSHWVPYLPKEALDAGIDLSDILSKPTEVEKYQPVSENPVQPVSGTVSVTGFARFVADCQTEGFWIALARALTGLLVRVDGFAAFAADFQSVKDVFTIPGFASLIGNFVNVLTQTNISDLFTYPGLLSQILTAIPTVVDYSDQLSAIESAALGIAFPAIKDYSSALTGIQNAVLGLSIPTVTDYSGVLNGILAGVTGISIPTTIDYSDVFASILAGVTGISIPAFPDISAILTAVFVPDFTPITDLKPRLEEHFGFIYQLQTLYHEFVVRLGYDDNESSDSLRFYSSDDLPDLSFTLPSWFGGGNEIYVSSIINFDLFERYRSYLHGAIIFFAYISWSRRFIKRFPSLLGYYGSGKD